MATEAKLKGNANYLSKFKTLSIRVPLDVFPSLEAAAAAKGESPSGYIWKAAEQRMKHDAEKACEHARERAALERVNAQQERQSPAPISEEAAAAARAIEDEDQRAQAMIKLLRGGM